MDWKTEYDDALLADKLGHAAFAYTTARTLSGLFMQCGYEKERQLGLGVEFPCYISLWWNIMMDIQPVPHI